LFVEIVLNQPLLLSDTKRFAETVFIYFKILSIEFINICFLAIAATETVTVGKLFTVLAL
jgi:hypothetical protein